MGSAARLACTSKLESSVLNVAINLEKQSEPIGTFYNYRYKVRVYITPGGQDVLAILNSDCSHNEPATDTAHLLLTHVEKRGHLEAHVLVFLSTIDGSLIQAASQTNHANGPPQAKGAINDPAARSRFDWLVKDVWSNELLAQARQRKATTKDGTGNPR